MKTKLLVLVVALAGGAAGGYFGRPAIEHAIGASPQIEARVVAERREDERLVLTLRSGDDTMLATFRNRVDDIAELVTPGDTITLRTRASSVFADDVPIVRVAHPADVVAPENESEPEIEADSESEPELAVAPERS